MTCNFLNGKSRSFESKKLIAADILEPHCIQYNLIRSNFPYLAHAFILDGRCSLFSFLFQEQQEKTKISIENSTLCYFQILAKAGATKHEK